MVLVMRLWWEQQCVLLLTGPHYGRLPDLSSHVMSYCKHMPWSLFCIAFNHHMCPAGELWGGVPARFIRKLTEDERAALREEADDIRRIAWQHCAEELPYGTAWRGVEEVRVCGGGLE